MFKLRTKYSGFVHHFYDIDTLEDVILGLTNNEDEAKRIANIAENMKLGDGFATEGILLECMEEA